MNSYPRLMLAVVMTCCAITAASAQELKDKPKQDAPQRGQANPADQTDEKRQTRQLQDRMVQAMDQLIPGDLDKDSELAKRLSEVGDLFIKQKLEDARTRITELQKTNSNIPPADLLLANMFFAVNDPGKGRALLEKTAQDNPDYPATYAGFARMAISNRRVTDSFALLELMKQKIDKGTWNEEQKRQFRIEWLDSKVDVSVARGRFEKANGYLEELAKMLPENGKVQLRMAEIAFEQKKIDRAIDLLKVARSKKDNLLVPPLIIANWYRTKSDKENIEKWIKQAAQEFPTDKNVQVEFARWHMEQRNLAKAGIWIKRAEDNEASEYTTTFMKGQIAFIRRAYDVAEMHFARIKNARPADVDAQNLLALSLVESDNVEKKRKAVDLATISVRMQPNNPANLAVLGYCYFKLGDMQRAAQALGQVSRSGRISPEAAYFLARFLSDRGNKKEALRVLNTTGMDQVVFLYRSQADELKVELEKALADDKNQDQKNDSSKKDE